MDNKAFTAGVRIGGLNDRTEIKILICYLLASLKRPISHEHLVESISGQELVNYFEMQSAVQHLLEQNLISEGSEGYVIMPEGAEIAKQLEKSLPFSVKERAYKAAIELLQYDILKEQNITEITPLENGGYNLKCTITDNDFTLFSMDMYMPDEKTAKLAGDQFVKMGQDMFKCVLGIATQNPSVYKDILSRLTLEEYASIEAKQSAKEK